MSYGNFNKIRVIIMKASELSSKDLMVGDWLMFNDKPCQVKGLNSDDSAFLVGYKSLYYLIDAEPIPLTPEILEKNGFIQDTNYSFRFFSPKVYKTIDIGVDFTIKGFTFWYSDAINISCGNGSKINRLPCFVHALQHALKLCKIDKEIKL